MRLRATRVPGTSASAKYQAPAAPAMPSGALGIWYGDQYVNGARKYIPSAIASDAAPVCMWTGSRRLFASNKNIWSGTAVTVTDSAVTGPDGNTQASTVVGSTSGWTVNRQLNGVPAGQYTIGIHVKSNTGTNQGFRLALGATTSSVLTATTAWQRFTLTTTWAGGNIQVYIQNDGSTAASIQIDNFECFAGAADLGPEPSSWHISLGGHKYDTNASVTGGVISMPNTSGYGLLAPPSATTFSTITVVAIARKIAASSGYVAVFARPNLGFNNFGINLERNNIASFSFGGDASWSNFTASSASGWDWNARGFQFFAHRYNGSTRSIFVNGGELFRSVSTAAAQTDQDLLFGTIGPGTYGSGWEYAAMALYNRALSDAEILQAQASLWARLASNGISRGSAIRVLAAEGDSITAATTCYPYLFLANQSPKNIFLNYALAGGGIAGMNSRAAQLDAILPAATDRQAGAKYILTFLIGANDIGGGSGGASDVSDMATYASQLTTYIAARRAAGWTHIAVCTVLPRTLSGYNARRNILNTTIRSWAGSTVNAVIDFAADATMGPDAAAADTSLYSDGLHPTNAGQVLLEPIYRAVVNAL